MTADHGLESKHRALWALGDYTTVATEVVSPLGPVLVQASGIDAGDRVLDVAAGAGNAAIPAALTGAECGRQRPGPGTAGARMQRSLRPGASTCSGVKPMPKRCRSTVDEFDAVLSCVGVMFAPHHQSAADELVRVCRSGGTIAADQLDARRLHRPDVRAAGGCEAWCAARAGLRQGRDAHPARH